MEPDSWPKLGLLIIGILLSAVALAGETAFRAIPHPRLQHLSHSGDSRAVILERWQERSDLFSASTLTLSLTGFVLATLMAVLLAQAYAALWGIAVYFGATLFIHSLIRGLAFNNPEGVALVVAYPLNILGTIFSPFTRLLVLTCRPIISLCGPGLSNETPSVTEEELRAWVGAGEESGILEEEQRDMIDGILEMEETTTHEVMVPRPDIVAVEGDTPVNRAADVVNRYGFSRMPVYQDSIDTILGILYSKDLLRELREGRDDRQVKELVRPAYFVPESKRVSELLQELQRRKVHIALVVDEYGGIAGLVTIEDLLEEIVGEIQDEHDSEEPKEQITGQGEGIFDATVSVDDVNEALGLRLHAEEADTIGGLVYEKLGEIPVAGDTVAADGVLLTVLATTGRRIRRVKVLAQPSPEQIAGEGNVHLDVEVG